MLKKAFNLTKSLNKVNKFTFKSSSAKFSELKRFNESFLNASQADYIDAMFDQWNKDKNSVPASWQAYFSNVARGADAEHSYSFPSGQEETVDSENEVIKSEKLRKIISDNLKIRLLLDNYRTRGHEVADLDPLKLNKAVAQVGGKVPDSKTPVSYKDYGFTEEDLDKQYYIFDHGEGFTSSDKKITLRNLVEKMEDVYCDKIGYQYMHLQSHEERHWIRQQIEKLEENYENKDEQLVHTGTRLLRDQTFVNFLKNTFSTAKRFGSEGTDSFISGLEALVDEAAKQKVEHIVIGMAHRGRINTLYNVVKKPAAQIFAEFLGTGVKYEENDDLAGDVKYHLGVSHDKVFPQYDNHTVRMSILPNPSHLETVDPLVYGKTRATQDFIGDNDREKAIGILVHGDAAVSGQGVVYETIQFQDLDAYTVGGIVHVVVNNQIGFTTVPQQNRTSLYCTDIAETVQAPVFHVNAEAPDQVDKVMKLALAFRQQFKKDVVVDVIGYRKHGHNELDQPMFTQPLMYKQIANKQSIYEIYRDKLFAQGVWTPEAEQKSAQEFQDFLKKSYEESRSEGFETKSWDPKEWEVLKVPTMWGNIESTGIPKQVITQINESINILPEDFNANRQIEKIYRERYESIKSEQEIDYGTGEALALGSLLIEGYGVRITGQDVERGTFSHRHSKLNDQKVDRDKLFPLTNLLSQEQKQQNALTIANSNLSEYGVCGFEYGYAISNPNNFVMWEAQFGDFANGAQIIFDNYMASAESKWGLQSQLVINLPHGMDGQGSEHSSGRIERFVQLSSDDPTKFSLEGDSEIPDVYENCNIQVIVPSTPANYFHALRRQMRREFRKPLISFSSKKLLKFRQAFSPLKDFVEGTKFIRVIPDRYPDEIVPKDQAKKVILCSGQVFYDLLNERRKRNINDVHILRLEQLCPFPYDSLYKELHGYSNAEFLWVQEEHWNQGGNAFVRPRYRRVLKKLLLQNKVKSREVTIVSRAPSAASATGSGKQHSKELKELLNTVFA